MIRKGEIYYINITDAIGSEQSGTRPVLVIQNNVGNKYSPTTIVAFITSQDKAELPTHVTLDEYCGLSKKSMVMLEQVRTIDKTRLKEKIGQCSKQTIECVNRAIDVSFFLTDADRGMEI